MYICPKCNAYLEGSSCPQGHSLFDNVASMPTRQYKPLRAFGHGLILGSAFLVVAAFSGGAIIDGFVAAFEKFSLSHESIFSTGPSATEVTRGWLRDGLYFVLLALVTSMGIHWMSRARSPLSQAGALRELGRNRKLAGVGMSFGACP